jgi:hypothetical protein
MSSSLGSLASSPPRPHNRRLFGIVLRAFYQACDQPDLEAATALLEVLTHLVSSSDASHRADRRRSEHDLHVAHQLYGRLVRHL